MKRVKITLIGLALIVIFFSFFTYLKYTYREIALYSESSATEELVSLYFDTNINTRHRHYMDSMATFPDVESLSTSDLLLSYQNTDYIPVMKYLLSYEDNQSIEVSYTRFSDFLRSLRWEYNVEPWDILIDHSEDGVYQSGKEVDNGIEFLFEYIYPQEDFLRTKFYEMISNLGYSQEYYLYDHLLSNSNSLILLICENIEMEEKVFSAFNEHEKNLAYDYISAHYEELYNTDFEASISYFINEFGTYLNTLELNTVPITRVELKISVIAIKEKTAKFNKYDKYVWMINYNQYFNQLEELNLPYLF